MRLAGKTVLITGAAKGIGAASARLFAAEGAAVAVADIDDRAGTALVTEIGREGGRATYVPLDITDPRSVESAFAATLACFGPLDVLYNNAGGARPGDGRLSEVADEAFWQAIGVDLHGTWLCAKAAIPQLKKACGGVIVNTASVTALIGHPNVDAYTAAKGGVVALTRAMAAQLAADGIRVNAVAPGATRTQRIAQMVADGRIAHGLIERHPLGLLEPMQIARAALFLASEDSSGITGQVLVVDGGLTASAVGQA